LIAADPVTIMSYGDAAVFGSTTRCARKSALNARWLALEEAATTQPSASAAR
jgi:hypothetical protein